MTTRAWLYFAIVSILWGIPYFFIKIAVGELSPAVVVFARVAIGALMLLPVAVGTGALAGLRGRLGRLVLLAVVEVIAPFLLIATAEQSIPSSLTSILIACVPLVIALLALWLDASERVTGWRLAGLLGGLAGVIVALGVDLGQGVTLVAALLALLACLGYGTGPLLVKRWFADAPSLGVTAAILAISAVVLLLPAMLTAPHRVPSPGALGALVVLGIACTGLGYVSFFTLIGLAGAGRAGIITYVTPVVALLLGVGFGREPLTANVGVGFVLIVAGSWLATRRPGPRRAVSPPAAEHEAAQESRALP